MVRQQLVTYAGCLRLRRSEIAGLRFSDTVEHLGAITRSPISHICVHFIILDLINCTQYIMRRNRMQPSDRIVLSLAVKWMLTRALGSLMGLLVACQKALDLGDERGEFGRLRATQG